MTAPLLLRLDTSICHPRPPPPSPARRKRRASHEVDKRRLRQSRGEQTLEAAARHSGEERDTRHSLLGTAVYHVPGRPSAASPRLTMVFGSQGEQSDISTHFLKTLFFDILTASSLQVPGLPFPNLVA